MSAEAKQPQGLVPGRIVHYVPEASSNKHDVWPAIVLWPEGPAARVGNVSRLYIISPKHPPVTRDVPYDPEGSPQTWHWMFEGQEKGYLNDPPSETPTIHGPGTGPEPGGVVTPKRGPHPDADRWAHRSAGMRCKTCMWFVRKLTTEPHPGVDSTGILGRCRRHAPTMSGYPAVFEHDWCGEHKLDETKL